MVDGKAEAVKGPVVVSALLWEAVWGCPVGAIEVRDVVDGRLREE